MGESQLALDAVTTFQLVKGTMFQVTPQCSSSLEYVRHTAVDHATCIIANVFLDPKP